MNSGLKPGFRCDPTDEQQDMNFPQQVAGDSVASPVRTAATNDAGVDRAEDFFGPVGTTSTSSLIVLGDGKIWGAVERTTNRIEFLALPAISEAVRRRPCAGSGPR